MSTTTPDKRKEQARLAASILGSLGGSVTGKTKSRGDSKVYSDLAKARWAKVKAAEKGKSTKKGQTKS